LDQGPTQRIDIHEGLDNTLIILRSKLGKGIKVTRDYASDLPEIEAYGSELNQVWTNIISNASEAMGETGELILRTGRENGWIFVEIQDTGPGIPEEIQGKIFSPFFTTKPVGKGTGLGLNISYNIIQKHGGEIRVFSGPGKTCFQVLLPTTQRDSSSGPAPLIGPVGSDQSNS
jgi:signal transduction histidine kinase